MKKKIGRKKASDKYYNLDVARYLSSVLIIIVHLEPFAPEAKFARFLLNNTIVRLCVPLFFMITAYFLAKKEEEDENYTYKYIKSLLPLYLFWSLIYIPQGLSYLKSINLSPSLYPLALLIGLTYLGTYYHLWYFPALIFGLLLLKYLRKHFDIRNIMYFSVILLLIGSFETYFGFLPGILQRITDKYLSIFFTTRNFLFFGLFYLSLGYYLAIHKSKRIKHSLAKTFMFLAVFIIEMFLIYNIQRRDSNIILSAVPLSYYAFTTFLNTKKIPFIEFKFSLRQIYSYYYFIHPLVFLFLSWIIPEVFKISDSYRLAFVKVLLALIIVHTISFFILELKKKYPKLPI